MIISFYLLKSYVFPSLELNITSPRITHRKLFLFQAGRRRNIYETQPTTLTDDMRQRSFLIGIWICQEIGFNSLEQAQSLLFASLNLVFCDLKVTFGMVLASALADGSSTGRSHQLDLIRNWFKGAHQSISLNHTVTVCEVLFVYSINPVLHIIELAPCIYINKFS